MKSPKGAFRYLLPALLLVQGALNAQVSERAGNVIGVKRSENGVELTLENAAVSVTAYSPTVIRIRYTKSNPDKDVSYAVVLTPEKVKGSFTETPDDVRFGTDSLTLLITKKPFRMRFLNHRGKVLDGDDARFGISKQGTEISSSRTLFPDERFIGLGEKVGSLDRRGSSYVNWNTDHYAYTDRDDPLYLSIPFFIGLHDGTAFGIFLDNSYRTKFDFGASTDNTAYSFSAIDGELNYYFFGGSTVASIIDSYTALTGRAKLPPLWSLGYQQCRWSYYPDTEVLELARNFRAKHIPADVIYLDIHYMDAYKIFTWHPDRFSRPKEMIDSLKRMGFHLVTIVDPGIKIEKGYFAHDEGVKNSYFIKYPGGENYIGSVWPGRCYFPDFTNGDVRKWWGSSFAKLAGPGVEGFWNDMNEPAVWGQNIPDFVEVDFDGKRSTMREAHNVYGMEMARSTYEGAKELMGGKRPFVLTRAGYAGIQRYSAVWTGDNVPSDDHMMLAVRLVNSMGLSGIPFTGPDVGGFAGDATPELFTRWMSIGAYTPFFRNHKQNGMKRQEPWSLGESVEEKTRRSIEERYRLMPYIYSTFYESTQNGMPVARSLAIEYPFDEHVYWGSFQHEYLFGKNILVAPATSTSEFVEVYFPDAGWYRSSDEEYFPDAGRKIVKAPLDDLPVFVRAGAIVPKQSLVQYTLEQPSDTLELHVYYGKRQSTFTYYEDDGTSFSYEKGAFHKRIMTYDASGKELILGKAEGSYATRYKHVAFVFHGFAGVRKATINGTELAVGAIGDKSRALKAVAPLSNDRISVRWKE